MKHTKGPNTYCDQCGEHLMVDEEAIVCSSMPFDFTSGRAGESAVLCHKCCTIYAAAPDLLEACIQLLKIVCDEVNARDYAPYYEKEIEKVSGIIAKAKEE